MIKPLVITGGIVCIALLGLVIFGVADISLGDKATTYVLDRLNWKVAERLPCDELPTVAEVERVLKENALTVKKIEDRERGVLLTIINDASRCPGKAHLLITFDTVVRRQGIKELLGESFFGVPYDMQNV